MATAGARDYERLLEREVELTLLRDLITRAPVGEGAVLGVEGQAGLGKTELL
jgi:predicted ATPase